MIYAWIGRWFVRSLRRRHRRRIRVGLGLGAAALAVGTAAYIASRGAPEG